MTLSLAFLGVCVGQVKKSQKQKKSLPKSPGYVCVRYHGRSRGAKSDAFVLYFLCRGPGSKAPRRLVLIRRGTTIAVRRGQTVTTVRHFAQQKLLHSIVRSHVKKHPAPKSIGRYVQPISTPTLLLAEWQLSGRSKLGLIALD